MSKEFKSPRKIQEIEMAYTNLCMRAGDLQFKMQGFAKDLETINAQLQELNFEAIASHKAEQESKKQEEASKAAAEKPAAEVVSINQEQSNA